MSILSKQWLIKILDSLFVYIYLLAWRVTKFSLGAQRLGWMSSFPLKDNSCILPGTCRKSCIFHFRLIIFAPFITFYYLHYMVNTLLYSPDVNFSTPVVLSCWVPLPHAAGIISHQHFHIKNTSCLCVCKPLLNNDVLKFFFFNLELRNFHNN